MFWNFLCREYISCHRPETRIDMWNSCIKVCFTFYSTQAFSCSFSCSQISISLALIWRERYSSSVVGSRLGMSMDQRMKPKLSELGDFIGLRTAVWMDGCFPTHQQTKLFLGPGHLIHFCVLSFRLIKKFGGGGGSKFVPFLRTHTLTPTW